MAFILASALLTIALTIGTARYLTLKHAAISPGGQIILSAMSFPIVATAIFVVVLIVTLVSPGSGHSGSDGMVIFALFFFLVYALMVGAVVGVPTAVIAVKTFRP